MLIGRADPNDPNMGMNMLDNPQVMQGMARMLEDPQMVDQMVNRLFQACHPGLTDDGGLFRSTATLDCRLWALKSERCSDHLTCDRCSRTRS